MPTSFHKHISDVMDFVIEKKPKTVLDIGVGNGKWGFLSREYLDIYGRGSNWRKETRTTRIEGIEAFSPYVMESPHITEIYDYIYIGKAQEEYYKIKRNMIWFL